MFADHLSRPQVTGALHAADPGLILVDPHPVVPVSPHRDRKTIMLLCQFFGLALIIIIQGFFHLLFGK